MPYFASCHKVRHKVMLDVQFICWCSQELYCSTGPVLSHPTLFSYARPGAFSSGTGQSTRDKTAACSANMCNVAGQARMTRTGRVQPLIRRGLRVCHAVLVMLSRCLAPASASRAPPGSGYRAKTPTAFWQPRRR